MSEKMSEKTAPVFNRLNTGLGSKSAVVALALTVSALALPGYSGYAAPQTPKPPTAMDDYRRAVNLEQQGDIKAAEAAIRDSLSKAPGDTLNTIKLAQLLTEQGRYNEAESLYKQALSLDANDGMIYFHLGGLYEQTGKYAEAKQAYATGLQRNPQYTYGLYNLARTQIQLQEYNDALGSYRQFLTQYPNHYEARQRMANLYLVAGQPEASAHEFSELQRQFPQHFNQHLPMAKALTRASRPEQALEELKAAFIQDGNKADVLQEMGLAHMALGQTDYALQNFEKALTTDPKRTELLLQMADIQFEDGQLTEAENNYRNFLKTNPDDNNVRYTLASLLMKQEKYDGAIEQLTAILQTNINDVQRYNLEKETAYAYQMKGDLMQAIPRYEALMKKPRSNDDVQLKTNLALAYHHYGNLEDAVNMYKSAYYQWQVHGSPEQQQNSVVSRAALASDLANALNALGDKAYKTGNYTEALQQYGEAALYSSDKQFAHLVGMGNSYLALGVRDKAEDAYKKALVLDPKNKTATLYLAKIDLEDHNNANSLPTLEKLATENPGNIEFQLALGDAYAQLGQQDNALTTYQKALDNQQLTDPQQREAVLLSMGAMEQSRKNFNKALSIYQMALSIDASNPKTHYNLGIIYNELNQLDRSLAAYKQAITLDNTMTEAVYGMAVTYEKQQKFADAISTYQLYVKNNQGKYVPQATERITLLENVINPGGKKAVPQANETATSSTPNTSPDTTDNTTTVHPVAKTQPEPDTELIPLKPAMALQEAPVESSSVSKTMSTPNRPQPLMQPFQEETAGNNVQVPQQSPIQTQAAPQQISQPVVQPVTQQVNPQTNTATEEDSDNFMQRLTVTEEEADEVTSTLTKIPNANDANQPINTMNVAEPQVPIQNTTPAVNQIQIRIDPME